MTCVETWSTPVNAGDSAVQGYNVCSPNEVVGETC
jgi:hypothetical protein